MIFKNFPLIHGTRHHLNSRCFIKYQSSKIISEDIPVGNEVKSDAEPESSTRKRLKDMW